MIFENSNEIFIYSYVEELISSFTQYCTTNFKNSNLTIKELSVLLKIRFEDSLTQNDLVNMFKVSPAYIAKLMRKFEDNGYIKRNESPNNRRKKIVRLTDEGFKKTDEYLEVIKNWENTITSDISDDEIKTLKGILFKIS